MSVPEHRPTAGVSLAPAGLRATVDDDTMDTTDGLSRETFAHEPQLHYLGYFRHGRCDFSMDVLDNPGLRRGACRQALTMLGTQLTCQAIQFDEILQAARTGELIRTVLHTPAGVVICDSVVPGEHLMGFGFHAAAAYPVDRAVSGLATELRRRKGMASLNPGGWETASVPSPVLAYAPPMPPYPSVTRPFASVLGRGSRTGFDAFRRDMRPTELHVVAYCEDGVPVRMVDQLGHPWLADFFQGISVNRRRKFYLEFCRTLGRRLPKLNRLLTEVPGGPLVRFVLDVEQGAVYYRRLTARTYLFGVTIDQRQVSECDRQMEKLAREFEGTLLRFDQPD